MIRPRISNVAALSGTAAKGHQAIPCVAFAPSKTPHRGFFLVRLQNL